MKILVIEDEKDIVQAIEYNFKKEGFEVSKAYDGLQGLKQISFLLPDIILLDLMLPGMDGLEILRRAKKDPKTENIPVIILTAKSQEADRVVGLELGADDYITKPFSVRELVARVKAVLKRYGVKAESPFPTLKFGTLEINSESHEVKSAGKQIELTAKEFALLHYLASNKGKVVGRERLLDAVWGVEVAIETRTVDVHIRRLREKLGKAGKHIKTLRGVGYRFIENA